MSDIWVEHYAGAAEKWVASSVGDSLVGTYHGWETVTLENGEEIRYFLFRDDAGETWSVPNSHEIVKALNDVPVGSRVKLTYKGEMDLGKKGHNPMKRYSLMVAK